jgi:hypothetical protein
MNPLWWIVIAAAAILAGAFALDRLAQHRHVSRCWFCGARRGEPHRRGCQSEPKL